METVSLRSGRTVAIRRIRPDDLNRLRAAHDRLSPESKYARFLAAKPHLSLADARYLVDVDGWNHFALVATSVEGPEEILGVARFVRLPEDRRVAEFAIVVGDAFQREGLASELLERLADAALAQGIERFTATTLATNEAVHRLIRRLAGRLPRARRVGHLDEIEFELAS
ncbi:MAG: GNAT family N-acetyltransferase [Actinomycetota bacterium]|nr:GNAT family N-acetyltransferase [Actinomycetota bacterium]